MNTDDLDVLGGRALRFLYETAEPGTNWRGHSGTDRRAVYMLATWSEEHLDQVTRERDVLRAEVQRLTEFPISADVYDQIERALAAEMGRSHPATRCALEILLRLVPPATPAAEATPECGDDDCGHAGLTCDEYDAALDAPLDEPAPRPRKVAGDHQIVLYACGHWAQPVGDDPCPDCGAPVAVDDVDGTAAVITVWEYKPAPETPEQSAVIVHNNLRAMGCEGLTPPVEEPAPSDPAPLARYPRFADTALLAVDPDTVEMTGAEWNEYVAGAERAGQFVPLRIIGGCCARHLGGNDGPCGPAVDELAEIDTTEAERLREEAARLHQVASTHLANLGDMQPWDNHSTLVLLRSGLEMLSRATPAAEATPDEPAPITCRTCGPIRHDEVHLLTWDSPHGDERCLRCGGGDLDIRSAEDEPAPSDPSPASASTDACCARHAMELCDDAEPCCLRCPVRGAAAADCCPGHRAGWPVTSCDGQIFHGNDACCDRCPDRERPCPHCGGELRLDQLCGDRVPGTESWCGLHLGHEGDCRPDHDETVDAEGLPRDGQADGGETP